MAKIRMMFLHGYTSMIWRLSLNPINTTSENNNRLINNELFLIGLRVKRS